MHRFTTLGCNSVCRSSDKISLGLPDLGLIQKESILGHKLHVRSSLLYLLAGCSSAKLKGTSRIGQDGYVSELRDGMHRVSEIQWWDGKRKGHKVGAYLTEFLKRACI